MVVGEAKAENVLDDTVLDEVDEVVDEVEAEVVGMVLLLLLLLLMLLLLLAVKAVLMLRKVGWMSMGLISMMKLSSSEVYGVWRQAELRFDVGWDRGRIRVVVLAFDVSDDDDDDDWDDWEGCVYMCVCVSDICCYYCYFGVVLIIIILGYLVVVC